MKKCKVYSTENNFETDAVIVDKKVLLATSHRSETEPTFTANGIYFYPPYYATDAAKSMKHGLMPFSVECKWGDFDENNGKEKNVVPGWASFWGGDGYEEYVPEKWGYCNTKTGIIEINPQWEECFDFHDCYAVVKGILYGTIDQYGEYILDIEYSYIKKITDDSYICRNSYEWFYINPDGDLYSLGAFGAADHCYDVFWDGLGEFSFEFRYPGGANEYGIINVIRALTEPPERYDPPFSNRREPSYWDGIDRESFRIIKRDEKYGLVRDICSSPNPEPFANTYSELILEPEHSYEDAIEATKTAALDAEIRYYAILVSRVPQNGSGHNDIWESVPENIREDVRKYMGDK